MSDYQEAVQNHPLFQEYEKLADFEHVSSADIAILRGLVLDVARTVEPHMKRISQTFQQYTDHDWTHLKNIASHIHAFLPKRKNNNQLETVHLNAVELTYLWLAILLHDVGMFVSDSNEKQSILDLEDYREHLHFSSERLELAEKAEAAGQSVAAGAIRDAIFAEFIRRRHAERVHRYIAHNLADKLVFRGADLSTEVGTLCESHGWGVFDSANPKHLEKCVKELDLKKLVGQTPVNLRYLSCCLRLGDILDFDRTRTPMSARQEIHFSEAISAQEWDKHLSIEGVEITTERVAYEAKCKGPDDYVAVQEFLNWVDRELADCGRLIAEFPAEFAERYEFKLPPVVDRWRVKMANPNYVAGAFRFQLEYDQIMKLLMDKSLYPDPSLFLRELLQNSLDACRYQEALATDHGMADKYVPRIQVEDLSSLPHDPENPENGPRIIFRDNGIGMSQEQVENYFLRAGKSFYRSADFKAERQRLADKGIHLDACSRFGIGFLSCFLVGDQIEVVTHRNGSQPLKIKIEGQSRYFVVERLTSPDSPIPYLSPEDPEQDRPPSYAGTSVTVWLRKEAHEEAGEQNSLSVHQTLNAVAVNQPYDIRISDVEGESHVITAERWNKSGLPEPYFHKGLFGNLKGHGLPSHRGRNSELAEFLVPVTAELQTYVTNLFGKVTFWFLSQEGSPALKFGFLEQRRDSISLSPFVSTAFDFFNEMRRCDQSLANEIKADFDCTLESSEHNSDLFNLTSDYPYMSDSRDAWEYQCNRLVSLAKQSGAYCDWLAKMADILPNIDRHKSVEWFSKDTLAVLRTGDLSRLFEHVKTKGLPINSSELTICMSLNLALFGIAIPGGIQSWEESEARAIPHYWLPGNVTVHCDAYGSLAPEPAASRLFIPYDRSKKLRDAITIAVMQHAEQVVKKHGSTLEWRQWFSDFVKSWDESVLASAGWHPQ